MTKLDDIFFFFSSRRRHTRYWRDWSSDVCSSDLRMYRTDIQGVCDSLVYNSKDSCMTMYRDPILWNENQQLLGEEIKIYMNDSTIDWAHIINQALTVEMKDSVHYNQVSGKEMKAYFENRDM